MRLRHIPGAEEAIAASPYVVQEPEREKGQWSARFGNKNPIEIEVGMGKAVLLWNRPEDIRKGIILESRGIPASFCGV